MSDDSMHSRSSQSSNQRGWDCSNHDPSHLVGSVRLASLRGSIMRDDWIEVEDELQRRCGPAAVKDSQFKAPRRPDQSAH